MRARRPREDWLPGFVKIAAIGTLADVVPLVGENRVIAQARARHAVARAAQGRPAGAARRRAGSSGRRIDSYHVGFVIAPRINAAGRMSTPDIATRLLLAVDEALAEEARALAEQLNAENTRRQQEEAGDRRRGAEDRRDRSRRRRRAPCSSSRARAGTAASSASWPASSSTRSTGRPIVLSIEGGRGPRLVPQHPGVRHARRARSVRAAAACASAGTRRRPGWRSAAPQIREFRAARQRPRRRAARPRRPAAAAADRRRARLRRRHRAARRRRWRRSRRSAPANPRPVFARERRRDLSTARAASRSATSRWRSGTRGGCCGRSRGGRRAPRRSSRPTGRRVDVAFALEQNHWNGETYLEVSLSDIRPTRHLPADPAGGRHQRGVAVHWRWTSQSAWSLAPLPEPDVVLRMASWQKRARLVVAAVGIAVVVVVALTVRHRAGAGARRTGRTPRPEGRLGERPASDSRSRPARRSRASSTPSRTLAYDGRLDEADQAEGHQGPQTACATWSPARKRKRRPRPVAASTMNGDVHLTVERRPRREDRRRATYSRSERMIARARARELRARARSTAPASA